MIMTDFPVGSIVKMVVENVEPFVVGSPNRARRVHVGEQFLIIDVNDSYLKALREDMSVVEFCSWWFDRNDVDRRIAERVA